MYVCMYVCIYTQIYLSLAHRGAYLGGHVVDCGGEDDLGGHEEVLHHQGQEEAAWYWGGRERVSVCVCIYLCGCFVWVNVCITHNKHPSIHPPTHPSTHSSTRTEVRVEEEAQRRGHEGPQFVRDEHHEQAVGQDGHGAGELFFWGFGLV